MFRPYLEGLPPGTGTKKTEHRNETRQASTLVSSSFPASCSFFIFTFKNEKGTNPSMSYEAIKCLAKAASFIYANDSSLTVRVYRISRVFLLFSSLRPPVPCSNTYPGLTLIIFAPTLFKHVVLRDGVARMPGSPAK